MLKKTKDNRGKQALSLPASTGHKRADLIEAVMTTVKVFEQGLSPGEIYTFRIVLAAALTDDPELLPKVPERLERRMQDEWGVLCSHMADLMRARGFNVEVLSN